MTVYSRDVIVTNEAMKDYLRVLSAAGEQVHMYNGRAHWRACAHDAACRGLTDAHRTLSQGEIHTTSAGHAIVMTFDREPDTDRYVIRAVRPGVRPPNQEDASEQQS